jgi:hypothetical protein
MLTANEFPAPRFFYQPAMNVTELTNALAESATLFSKNQPSRTARQSSRKVGIILQFDRKCAHLCDGGSFLMRRGRRKASFFKQLFTHKV